jgi:WD40 repeat protein
MPELHTRPYDLFVSYIDADRGWVEGYLLDRMRSAGMRCLTQADFQLGAVWTAELERAVAQSSRVLLVLSAAYRADVNQEFLRHLACYHELKSESASVIPLLLDDGDIPLGLEIKVSLRATTDQERADAVERLAQECRAGPPTVRPEPRCPYPGMAPFDRGQADLFRGRKREVEQLLQELRHRNCLFLIGRSGSGKSSLVLAGLLPRLEEGRTVHVMRPGATPAATLAALNWEGGYGRCLLVVDQFEEVYTRATAEEATRFQEALRAWTVPSEHVLLATVRADFYPDLQGSPAIFPLFQANHRDVLPLGKDALREAIVGPATQAGMFVEPALVERLLADAACEPCVLPHLQETLQLLWGRRRRRYLPLEAYEGLGSDGRTGLQEAMVKVADAAVDDLAPEDQALVRRTLLRLVQFGEGREDTRRSQPLLALESAGDPPGVLERVLARLIVRRLVVPGVVRVGTTDAQVLDLAHEALITGWPRLQGWVREAREAEQTRRRLEDKATEWEGYGRKAGLLDDVELAEAERWLETATANGLGASAALKSLVTASREAVQRRKERETAALQERARQAEALAAEQKKRAEEQATAGRRLRRRFRFAAAFATAALVAAVAAGVGVWWALDEKQKAVNATEEAKQETAIANSRRLAALASNEVPEQLDTAMLLAFEAFEASKGAPTFEARDVLLTILAKNSGLRAFLRGHENTVGGLAFSPDGLTLSSWSDKFEFDDNRQLTSSKVRVISWDIANGHVKRIWDVPGPLRPPRPGTQPIARTLRSDGGAFAIEGDEGKGFVLWDLVGDQPTRRATFSSQDSDAPPLVVTPDLKTAITVKADGPLTFWGLASDPVKVLATHKRDKTSSIIWCSPDGKTLVEVDGGGSVVALDVATGREKGRLPKGSPWTRVAVSADSQTFRKKIAVSADGQTFAIGRDNTRLLWLDLTEGEPPEIPKWEDQVQVLIWDLTKGERAPLSLPFKKGEAPAPVLSWSPHGKILAAAYENTVTLWDLAEKEPRQIATLAGHTGDVTCLTFSPDGKILASGSTSMTRQFWAGPVQRLGGSRDNTVILWDVASCPKYKCLEIENWSRKRSAVDGDWQILGADGTVAVSVNSNADIVTWDVAVGEPKKTATFAVPWRKKRPAALAVSPDGKALAATDGDRTIFLWDVAAGPSAPKTTLQMNECPVLKLAIGPGGKALAAAGGVNPFRGSPLRVELTVWDLDSGQCHKPLPPDHKDAVTSVAFSRDGRTLAAGTAGGTVIHWDIAEGRLNERGRFRAHPYRTESLALSPSGTLLAVAGGDVSPRPEHVLGGAITLWDLAGGGHRRVILRQYQGPASFVTFSQNGSTLVSVGSDGTNLWDVESRRMMSQGPVIGGGDGMAFGPDSKTLILCSGTELVRWDIDPESWANRVGRMANRNFSQEEWNRFFPNVPYRRTFPDLPAGEDAPADVGD